MTDNDTLEGALEETSAVTAAYELSGRDRFAVKLIDAAVKVGTQEFQARYRPVTEELFSHHVIDPTAKPAYIPPTRDPIAEAISTGDPLEVVRSNLDAVIVDRQARDDARIRAEDELTLVAAELAVVSANAADLELRLAGQTSRASAAEAEVARLAELLHSETMNLNARRESEVKAAEVRRVSEVTDLVARHDADVESLTTKHELEVQTLTAQRVAEVSALEHQRETEIAALTSQRKTDIASLHEQRETVLAAQNIEHENSIAAVTGELSLIQAQHAEQLAVEQNAHEAELFRLKTDKTRELAELRAERQALIAALEGKIAASTATIVLLEEIAKEELCADDETDDYAIGANDVAARILDAI